MRSSLRAAIVAAVMIPAAWLPGPAHAANPVPVAVAKVSDDVAHPGSTTEWWYTELADPHSNQKFIFVTGTLNDIPTSIAGRVDADGHATWAAFPVTPLVTTNAPGVYSDSGSLVYDSGAKAYHQLYAYNGMSADIWFQNEHPGVTWGPMTMTNGKTINWTNPVADSTVKGSVWPVGSLLPIDVTGWRGYHDHNWGSFSALDEDWRGWDWGVSHNSDGTANVMWVPSNSDGTYSGVQVTASASGTKFCTTSNFQMSGYVSPNGVRYPQTDQLSCDDPSLTQTWNASPTSSFVITLPAPLNFFSLNEAIGTTNAPGSRAIIEHARMQSAVTGP